MNRRMVATGATLELDSSSLVTCSHELRNWPRLALVLNVNWLGQVRGTHRRGVIIINASFRSMDKLLSNNCDYFAKEREICMQLK